ncbi:hypothetical protein GCM10022381_02280 [Leifsonia kafniensis]|uniref:YtxH domain-containing protein n=1 Tax=Leifsonia kafniensis TaxID=475957 RepID=A0ABP7K164_9MICO
MKGKILFVAGVATGFMLGSKAGRQAYERIMTRAKQTWEDPAVQKTVSQVGQLAQDAASVAHTKMSEAMDHTATTEPEHEAEHSATADEPTAIVDSNESNGIADTTRNPGGEQNQS